MFILYELFCTALPVYRYQIMLLEIKLLNPKHCGKTCLHQQFKEKFAGHNLRMFTADVYFNVTTVTDKHIEYLDQQSRKNVCKKAIFMAKNGPKF